VSAGEFWEPSDDEFPYRVLDHSEVECGARRTKADALALAKRLGQVSPGGRPYRVVGPE
jgi:hypothetical protein